MTDSAYRTHSAVKLAPQVRAAKNDKETSHQQALESGGRWSAARSAAWNALIYIKKEKYEVDPRAIQFLENAIRNMTVSQYQKLQHIIQAEGESAHSEIDGEFTGIVQDAAQDPQALNIEALVAGLCNLRNGQLEWLSKEITAQLERYLISDRFDNQIRTGAYAHKLIKKRQKAREGQRTRLRGDGPYEAVMDNAMKLFGCSGKALAQAYSEFKWMRSARMVDENGHYVHARQFIGNQ